MQKLKHIFLALAPKERAVFFAALAAVAVSAFALTVLAVENATTVVPAPGGEYTEGMVGQPTYVNPVLAASDIDKSLVRLLFANLNDLADKTETDKNGRLWKIRLKENLRWSDGRKITTDDVIFTVQKIQDPETQSPLFASWQGVIASRLSELEMQLNLVSPYAFFPDNIDNLYPIPKHLFADTPSANWRLSEYNLKPAGSGPYLFDSYEKQPNGFITAYRFAPNPSYAGAHPLIQRFGVRFFAKPDNLFAAFNGASVDGFSSLDPQSLAKISRPYQTFSLRLPSYYAAFINQGQSLALKETGVRVALSLVADRESLVQKVFGGRAVPIEDPLGMMFPPLEDRSASPADPLSLLETAGWKPGEDGVREKKIKGATIRLEFDLTVPDIDFLVMTAEELRTGWQAVGAKANLIILPPEEVAGRVIKNREYQAILFGNLLNPPRDLHPFWASEERFYPGLNLALYNNNKVDQLIEAARRELDPDVRGKSLADLRRIIAGDYPALFLYSPHYLFVTSKDLRGVEEKLVSEPAAKFRDATAWHLKTARVLK